MSKSSSNLPSPPLVNDAASTALPCDIASKLLPWIVHGLGARCDVVDGLIRVEWPTNGTDHHHDCVEAAPDDWTWGSPPLSHLADEVAKRFTFGHAEPDGQPHRVHEFSAQLLEPYRVDGGRARLGGCTLEWIPLWRIDRVVEHHDGPRLATEFRTAEGELLDDEQVRASGLHKLSPLSAAPLRWAGAPPTSARDCDLATLVWRCRVKGKIVAEIGAHSTTVDVEGWAVELARGAQKPPPFSLAGTDAESYEVAADDDGDVGPADAIFVCAKTGRRLLQSKLSCCDASGEWIAAKATKRCGVTGRVINEAKLVACNMCEQPVDPGAVRGGRCRICRSLAPIAKEDALLARLIGEFPRLDRWSSWRMSESEEVYVLTAGPLLRRLLVVVRKEPLELVRVATGMRCIGGWTDATDMFRREIETE